MFNDIISFKNICEAWREFVRGKKFKSDVAEFSANLAKNIFAIHYDLKNKTYQHRGYKAFKVNDPKPRDIHKASVRDRIIHRAIYRILYYYFDQKFIFHSFSCRNNKGTHLGLNYFECLSRKVSVNNTRTAWILKCDIKKFFASVDQIILLNILQKHITNKDTLWLLSKIINSFATTPEKGMPLGNLTSQLFANIYMNEFDQFIKHKLRIKYYARYADDFVIISENKKNLEAIIPVIKTFLEEKLKLSLHANKIFIKTWASGIDFLGWISFPNHRVLRTATKRRVLKRIARHPNNSVVASYLGMLKHGNTYKLKQKIPLTAFSRERDQGVKETRGQQ